MCIFSGENIFLPIKVAMLLCYFSLTFLYVCPTYEWLQTERISIYGDWQQLHWEANQISLEWKDWKYLYGDGFYELQS